MAFLPEKLGIVAGGGVLPSKLAAFCEARGIPIFIIGFENQTDTALFEGRDHAVTRIGAAGQIIKFFKQKGYRDLVLIGSIKRPHLSELRPDLYTAAFFAKLGFRFLGDDSLLKAVRAALEKEGFTLHGIQELMSDLLMPEAVLGKVKPNKQQSVDIAEGMRISKAIGALDIGQAVIIQDGVILGVEGVEGTDELLRRCADYRQTDKGGILIKTCKPEQDRKVDMPTIGPDTVRLCAVLRFEGIAVEAGSALLVDLEESVAEANNAGMFFAGVKAP